MDDEITAGYVARRMNAARQKLLANAPSKADNRILRFDPSGPQRGIIAESLEAFGVDRDAVYPIADDALRRLALGGLDIVPIEFVEWLDALCRDAETERDLLATALEEEQELHGEARAERDRLRAGHALAANAADAAAEAVGAMATKLSAVVAENTRLRTALSTRSSTNLKRTKGSLVGDYEELAHALDEDGDPGVDLLAGLYPSVATLLSERAQLLEVCGLLTVWANGVRPNGTNCGTSDG